MFRNREQLHTSNPPPPFSSSRHPDRVDYLFRCADFADDLKIIEFSAVEELNRPYEATVHVEALDETTDLHKLVGKAASVELRRTLDRTRLFSGIVDRVRIADDGNTQQTGVVRIVPALALMALRRNSRIFQGQSAYQIIEAMLAEGLSPYRRTFNADGLNPTDFITRNYCVQYRETDLEFVHRLMEDEGIGYYFDVTEDDVERVVLFENSGRLPRVETMDGAAVRYDNAARALMHAEPIVSFSIDAMLTSQGVALRETDWRRGDPILEATSSEDPSTEVYEHGLGHGATVHEDDSVFASVAQAAMQALVPDGLPVGIDNLVRDIPGFVFGSFTDHDVDRISRIRCELERRDEIVARGRGHVITFASGQIFELLGHPTLGADDDYLLTRVVHSSRRHERDEGAADEPLERLLRYSNEFTCMPRSRPWRPSRRTPKPTIAGVQTARVVGPIGSEIYTDGYARVKVRFAWDRSEPSPMGDDTCWIRVTQMWAGMGHPGTMFLPRVGMEVAVEFEDGDPDRPLINGTLYNARNPTPHAYPLHATKSTIKTRTVPGGMGHNELTFDDALGREEVFIRAERDFRVHAHHDHETFVGSNASVAVYGSKVEAVGKDSALSVGGESTVVTETDERRNIGRDSSVIVNGSRRVRVGRSLETVVESGSHLVRVDGGEHVVKSKMRMILTQGNENYIVMHTDDDPKGIAVESPHSIELHAGDAVVKMNADKDNAISISSPTRIVLSVGGSKLEITPDKITVNKKIMPA